MDPIVPGSLSQSAKTLSVAALTLSDGPMYREFVTSAARLGSFKKWKHEVVQSSANLSSAGFFYLGTKDRVCCFYCGIGLSKWEKTDNPWIEHAVHSSTCAFLLLNRSNWSSALSVVR